MQSITIYGGTRSLRIQRANEIVAEINNVNIENKIIINIEDGDKVISIEKVRSLIRFLNLKPRKGEIKVVLIEDGEKMTPEAQNALLKTLEEPPFYALIMVLTPSKRFLLGTILSRCLLIYAGNVYIDVRNDSKLTLEVKKLLTVDLGVRIDWVAKNKAKFKDRGFLEELLTVFEQVLRGELLNTGIDSANMGVNDVFNLNEFFTLKDRILNQNCSPALELEGFLINLR